MILNEAYAWRLLRDASANRTTRAQAFGGELEDGPSIAVDADGRWSTEAGIEPGAAELLDTLLPVALAGPRFVIAQIGQSLDGRIATDSGHSHYVTGRPSRLHLHRLRALVDAVLVGASTVAADDPQLTVRLCEGEHPTRVVLDPRGRLPVSRKVFTDGQAPTLYLGSATRSMPTGVEPVAVAADDRGRIAPQAMLEVLAERGLTRILVEGGGETISRFLASECLDRLHVVVAPLIIGSGRPSLRLPAIETLESARRPPTRSRPMGEDMFFDLDLRGR